MSFIRGSLDDQMRDTIALMPKGLKPTDLRFIKSAAQLEDEGRDAAAFTEVTSSVELTEQQITALSVTFRKWCEDLDTEASAHTVVTEQQLAWDSQDAACRLKVLRRVAAEKDAPAR